MSRRQREELEKKWNDIAGKTKTNMETFSREAAKMPEPSPGPSDSDQKKTGLQGIFEAVCSAQGRDEAGSGYL